MPPGFSAGASNNVLTVVGSGSRLDWLDSGLTLGESGSSNRLIIRDSAYLVTPQNLLIGNKAGASNNVMEVSNGGSVELNTRSLTVGSQGWGNSLVVSNGGQMSVFKGMIVGSRGTNNSVLITGASSLINLVPAGGITPTLNLGTNGLAGGTGGGWGNWVRIEDQAVLQADTLVTQPGNTISNVGGVFQFTIQNPTITPNGVGNIAITDGTISFTNVTSGLNLTNNWKGSQLTNLAWNGFNALRLNNSLATNTLAGGYTFDKLTGNATNYYRLEMINGTTKVSGTGLTFTNAGALLVSNTVATFVGVVTNYTAGLNFASSTITGQNGFVWMSGSAATTTPGLVTFSANTTNKLDSGNINWAQTANATQTVNGVVTGIGNLVKGGAGVLTLGAINTFTGSAIITNGTLMAGAANILTNSSEVSVGLISGSATGRFDLAGYNQLVRSITGAGSITNSTATMATLTVSNASAVTFAGQLTGSNVLVMAGSSPLTLSGANTYSGGTVVQTGTLKLGAAGALPNNQALQVNGGIFDQGGFGITVSSLNGSVGVITNNGLTVGSGGGNFSGVIAGTGALTNNGGVLTISGANTYSGGTVVQTGTLKLGGAGALPNNQALQVNGGIFDQGGFGVTVSSLNGSVGVITNNGLTVGSGGGNFSGVIAGTGALTNNGGVLTISGANTYSGGTVVQTGTLKLGGAGALPNNQALQVNGGILDQNGFAAVASTLNGSVGTITNAGLTVNSGGNFSGVIAGSGALTINGGLLTISGANTFTGGTTISNGLLQVGASTALPSGGAITVSGGALDLGSFNESVGQVTLGSGLISNGTLISTSNYQMQSGTNLATLAGSVALYKTTAGMVVLNGPGTYTGGTYLSNGTLRVNSTLVSPTVTVFSGGTLGGTGAISGGVTIQSGGIYAPGNSVGMQTNGALVLASGSILNFEFRTAPTTANDQIIVTNLSGLTIAGGAFNLYQEGGTAPFDTRGVYNLLGYTGNIGGSYTNLSIISPTDNRHYLFGTNGTFVTLAIGGSSGWNPNGGSPDNNWQTALNWGGNLAPVEGDDLLFDGNTGLNNTNNIAANTRFSSITFTNTARSFILNGNAVKILGSVANLSDYTQTINLPLVMDGGSREFNASNGALVVNGVISETGGSFGLSKTGTNTLTIAGANTYSGGTVVNSGTLLVNNIAGSGTGSGTVQVSAGATLGGTGGISGVVTINAGGTLSASAGGTLTLSQAPVLNGTAAIGNGATLNVGTAWSESTTVAFQGGTLIGGNLTNQAGGNLQGWGEARAALINLGSVTATNGELRLNTFSGNGSYQAVTSGTLTFTTIGTVNSLANSNGTVRLEAAATLTNTTSFNNAGTLAMVGGTYQTSTRLTNSLTAWITGYGTVNSAGPLVNLGTILASNSASPLVFGSAVVNSGVVTASNARLIISGVFTNNGTLSFLNSVGTFTSAVVNRGAWTTDPSTNVFLSTFTITSGGSISAAAGDVYRFQSNLINQSSQSTTWSTLNVTPGAGPGLGTEFLFSGAGVSHTQEFFHVGLLLTNGFVGTPNPLSNGVQEVSAYGDVAGFVNNFAVGELILTNTTLVLEQATPSLATNALFVNDLFLYGAAQLVISNNMQVYFVNSNTWDMSQITLWGDAQIHQLSGAVLPVILSVPEPNVLLMWLAGAGTFWVARRRRGARV